MAESRSNSDVDDIDERIIEPSVSGPKRTLETEGCEVPPARRVRRKLSDFGHDSGIFASADPDEEDPTVDALVKPPLSEVVVSPTSRCSFGAEMVAAPLDPRNVRAIVTSREEVVPAPSDDGPVELAASFDTPTDLVVDPEVRSVPMLLLGQKRTSKDKFYDLHMAMRCEHITFLVATLKDDQLRLVQPIECNLHDIVFSKQDAIAKWIHSEWCANAATMVRLVQSCYQVVQKRPDGTGTNVCLYLRVNATVVSGLEGDAASCMQFDSLKNSTGMNDAGLVMALDEVTVKKLKGCKEAAAFLHADVRRALVKGKKGSILPPPGTPTINYTRIDDFSLVADKTEHAAFKFRLKGSTVTPKAVNKRGSTAVRKSPMLGRPPKSAQSASSSSSEKTIVAPIESPVHHQVPIPPPAQATEPSVPSSALVVGNGCDEYPFENATDEQRRAWMEAGHALNATGGVQKPAYPGFPTILMFDIDPTKVVVQPMGSQMCMMISK